MTEGEDDGNGEENEEKMWGGPELTQYMENEWDEEFGDQDDLHFQADFLEDKLDNSEATTLPPSAASQSTVYQFCPLNHQLPILRLFAKHASQHSLLPEQPGKA